MYGRIEPGGLPPDFPFINALDELRFGDEVSELTEPPVRYTGLIISAKPWKLGWKPPRAPRTAKRMWPAADLAQALVYSENGSSVDTMLVGGDVVLENGESPRIDEAALGRQAGELAERVERARSERAARKLTPEIADRLQAAEHEYREAASMPRK